MIKAVIVDDEPPARRELLRLLAAHKNVRVVGEAGDIDAARGLLLRTRPDAVFLDIRLGRRSGFDLLPDVDPETPTRPIRSVAVIGPFGNTSADLTGT